jgi:sec-independent protein translocase protein TatB
LYLFIFESIGTQELILIGIVALIFLGPRRMPEMARKIGKMMSDFRNTTNEFKSTWEREVNFAQEESALRKGELPSEQPVARTESENDVAALASIPEVRAMDAERIKSIFPSQDTEQAPETGHAAEENTEKRDWL